MNLRVITLLCLKINKKVIKQKKMRSCSIDCETDFLNVSEHIKNEFVNIFETRKPNLITGLNLYRCLFIINVKHNAKIIMILGGTDINTEMNDEIKSKSILLIQKCQKVVAFSEEIKIKFQSNFHEGSEALLCTDKSYEEVKEMLSKYNSLEFERTGSACNQSVKVKAQPLKFFNGQTTEFNVDVTAMWKDEVVTKYEEKSNDLFNAIANSVEVVCEELDDEKFYFITRTIIESNGFQMHVATFCTWAPDGLYISIVTAEQFGSRTWLFHENKGIYVIFCLDICRLNLIILIRAFESVRDFWGGSIAPANVFDYYALIF